MRNPNYYYEPARFGSEDGWSIKMADIIVWGKTKAATRSRLKRVLRERFKNKTTEEIYVFLKGNTGGTNDQS
jgi:hypothetical protein